MNLYSVDAMLSDVEGYDAPVLVRHFAEAESISAAVAIIRGVRGIGEDQIHAAELQGDKIWRMSDLRKGKGNA